MRSLLNTPETTEVRAVIGIPANADATAREHVRDTVAGLFENVILISEPFLAVMGYRDESRLTDPVRNSLVVDIGGGTTDVCMIQGCFPTTEDQISFAFAGDKVDALLKECIRRTYPLAGLSMLKVRELKEEYSFVAIVGASMVVTVRVGSSRIRNLGSELQRRLTEDGYEAPCVRWVGINYNEFVAMGALKAARQTRDNQWHQIIG